MVRLLREPIRPRISKAEAAGKASTKLRMQGMLCMADAAAYLKLHKYTVRGFIDRGLISSIKVTNRWYVNEAELERVKALISEHGSLAKAYKTQTKTEMNGSYGDGESHA